MLSGGLRQRVNIARSFIYPSKIIIMDEPFKSIDVINKEIIMNNFKKILEKEKKSQALSKKLFYSVSPNKFLASATNLAKSSCNCL